MATLEIPDFLRFEVTMDEVVRTTKLISKETKHGKTRKALKVMLRELRKGNKALIETLFIPLYEIKSKEDFNKKFSGIRTKFKRIYLDGRPVLAKINCRKVTNKLLALKESRNWKKRIPVIRRKIALLELLVDQWVANDRELYRADANLLKELNGFMDEINQVRLKDSKKAYNDFLSGLKDIEEDFLNVTNQFAELEVLSDQL